MYCVAFFVWFIQVSSSFSSCLCLLHFFHAMPCHFFHAMPFLCHFFRNKKKQEIASNKKKSLACETSATKKARRKDMAVQYQKKKRHQHENCHSTLSISFFFMLACDFFLRCLRCVFFSMQSRRKKMTSAGMKNDMAGMKKKSKR